MEMNMQNNHVNFIFVLQTIMLHVLYKIAIIPINNENTELIKLSLTFNLSLD